MIVGVDSKIGFFFITSPSLLQNAFNVFKAGGLLTEQSHPNKAIECSRSFAESLGKLTSLTPAVSNRFPHFHDRLRDQLEDNFPSPLTKAYEDYQKNPTVAGMVAYFNLLADILDESSGRRSTTPRRS